MTDLTSVILPVFLVVGIGYLARWRNAVSDAGIDGLMKFAQGFAIPLLLFRAISTLDLAQNFEWPLLLSFYGGAMSGFVIGLSGARWIFGRNWEDSVAIGFVGLFSNSLLLGLPITELASIFSNALVVGILAGLVVNLVGIPVPRVLADAIDLITRAAIPAALFGLGGVLYLYRPEGDLRTILFICTVSLLVHPAITWGLGRSLDLDDPAFRSAVITAAVAPGVNAYLFADMYGAARRVAASAVLIGTALTIVTATLWLALLASGLL